MSTLTLRGRATRDEGIALPRLGRYDLLRHLATGGMAELYLARVKGIEGFEKLVAIKRIRPELLHNRDMVTLFLDEARLAATLHHPNVVQVYDVGNTEGSFFFSMEFVHGQDVRSILRTAVSQDKPIPLSEALTIGIGVCSGLHYAHEKRSDDGSPLNIVHRDISPSNLIVSYDGAVKIVDFGIAKAASRTAETTVGGGVRGKLSYMSPEQCQHHPLDRRSDIFALGIVLYELTTCTKLFSGQSDYEVMKQIVEMPVPRPSERVPGYPRDLERIVMRALAHSPNERYATVEELQLELEAFARVNMLGISAVSLARCMSHFFRENIEAWQKAQREGHVVAAQVVVGADSDPSIYVEQDGAGSPPGSKTDVGPEPRLSTQSSDADTVTAKGGPPSALPTVNASSGGPASRNRLSSDDLSAVELSQDDLLVSSSYAAPEALRPFRQPWWRDRHRLAAVITAAVATICITLWMSSKPAVVPKPKTAALPIMAPSPEKKAESTVDQAITADGNGPVDLRPGQLGTGRTKKTVDDAAGTKEPLAGAKRRRVRRAAEAVERPRREKSSGSAQKNWTSEGALPPPP